MSKAQAFLDSVLGELRNHTYADYIKESPDEIAADVGKHAAVVIEGEMEEGGITIGCSKVGGAPDLPEGFAWPCEDDDSEEPLAFLCQVNLAEVHPHDLSGRLPSRGMLWVFSIADGDRAYSYEIDDDTTALYFDSKPPALASRSVPEALLEDEDALIAERRLVFGPSLCLSEIDEEGAIESRRYDGSIEGAIEKAIKRHGGRSGAVRLLGNAHFFREENEDCFDPKTEDILLSVDGYSVAQHAFGEGGFTWVISKANLDAGELTRTSLVFEPGT